MSGYGYYDEEEGFLTGGGLKSFRLGDYKKGEPSVTVSSLTWGINRVQRTGRRVSKSIYVLYI
jgi:hypothetical protein